MSSIGALKRFPFYMSCVLDWILVVAIAGIGAAIGKLHPRRRPFSIANPNISFPYTEHETIPKNILLCCSVVLPAGIIVLVCLLLAPGSTVSSYSSPAIWRRKVWQWHTQWLGLALSLFTGRLLTSILKNLIGKPRPDLLARCNPQLANSIGFASGGVESTTNGSLLVTAAICQTNDMSVLNDGFRSFPSGHSSFSASGLIYLSLFLAVKLGISIPLLTRPFRSPPTSNSFSFPSRAAALGNADEDWQSDSTMLASPSSRAAECPFSKTPNEAAFRDESAAAPPVYALVLVALPSLTAVYIAASRYSDFRHHGFDVLFGFCIGLTSAVLAFRFYQSSIDGSIKSTWTSRSKEWRFGAGLGVGNLTTRFSWEKDAGSPDVELGRIDSRTLLQANDRGDPDEDVDQ